MKIGFFDTGLGGLTVLKAVVTELPQYDYEYFGDTKNVPYGDKTEAEIYLLTKEAMRHLFEKECQLVIVACNTSSAETLRKLQDTFLFEEYPNRRILGVIIPAVEELIRLRANNTILLATKRTIESGKYEKELNKQSIVHTKLIGVATPELVPLIELGELEAALGSAKSVIENERRQVGEVDTVVLGCTHYTKLKEGLREHFKDSIHFISQDEIIPQKLAVYLEKHPEITDTLTQAGTRNVHLTQHRADYDAIIADLLGGSFLAE